MNSARPFELKEIGQVAINVQDLERAIQFYRDVLGLHFLFSAPPQMAFFDCGGVRLLLGVPEEEGLHQPASIASLSRCTGRRNPSSGSPSSTTPRVISSP